MPQPKGKGERPIQMGEQTQKPEPVKITGSSDMEVIMMMCQRLIDSMNKNTNALIESWRKDREENEKNRQKDREENKKWIESLKKEIICIAIYHKRKVR